MNTIKDQLDVAWVERNKLYTEGAELLAEGHKLRHKLRDEGYRLWTEGHKLWTEGSNLWFDKVAEVCGSECKIEWTTIGCIVMGMEFKSTDDNL